MTTQQYSQNLKSFIKQFVPRCVLDFYVFLRQRYFPKIFYRVFSYSQNGEDRALWRYFEGQRDGFYVDIGAHHPFRFSNTYIFYKSGWRGINVDAMPNSMRAFRRYRKHDINIECAVGNADFMENCGASMESRAIDSIKSAESKHSKNSTNSLGGGE